MLASSKDAKKQSAHGAAVATAVATARDLVNTPPSHLFPAEFAKRAKALGESAGLEVEVLDDKALKKAGYGGVIGVGQGSSRPPRLVRLIHRGSQLAKNPKRAKKVALVGKGVTFDTGGISIKPAASMHYMTSDMGGAAAVIATVVLAARLKLPIDVIATVPMAENMPSATAQRPGDVLTQYGGTTVEVLNTDAEGRLILADAIVRACEDNPDYLIETSTLTGAQTVALGARIPGVMGSDEFRDRVAELSQQVGRERWPMPLPDELKDDLKSTVADLANVSGQRFAGMLVAGVFLREFVADGVAWAHIDVAGPLTTPAARGATPPRGPPVCRPAPCSRCWRTSHEKRLTAYLVNSAVTARFNARRGQPVTPSAASAALAALRPHAPCTEPPGVAEALPKYSRSTGVSARPMPGAGTEDRASITVERFHRSAQANRRLASLASRSDGRCTHWLITREPKPGACSSMT